MRKSIKTNEFKMYLTVCRSECWIGAFACAHVRGRVGVALTARKEGGQRAGFDGNACTRRQSARIRRARIRLTWRAEKSLFYFLFYNLYFIFHLKSKKKQLISLAFYFWLVYRCALTRVSVVVR